MGLEESIEGSFKVLMMFPTLYHGWECDTDGTVIESEGGKRHIILTSHGNPYVADEAELDQLIESYRNAIRLTEMAKECKREGSS